MGAGAVDFPSGVGQVLPYKHDRAAPEVEQEIERAGGHRPSRLYVSRRLDVSLNPVHRGCRLASYLAVGPVVVFGRGAEHGSALIDIGDARIAHHVRQQHGAAGALSQEMLDAVFLRVNRHYDMRFHAVAQQHLQGRIHRNDKGPAAKPSEQRRVFPQRRTRGHDYAGNPENFPNSSATLPAWKLRGRFANMFAIQRSSNSKRVSRSESLDEK